jgi:cation diffusion facilitator family transporter
VSASDNLSRARRLTTVSIVASACLSGASLSVGHWAASTSVLAVGLEFAGDVLASAIVLFGLHVASRPPDENHPYGHGRVETIAGLAVGFILIAASIAIVVRSVWSLADLRSAPGEAALWVLAAVIAVRGALAIVKHRAGRAMGSMSLVADARNDAVDILSATIALIAVALARIGHDFVHADAYGGVIVGIVVLVMGLRVVRETSFALADTMPDPELTASVRAVAMTVPGVRGVEKQLARKTGLQYHIDLHIEVDPDLTVRASHEIAHQVKQKIRTELAWVADVLVHVEPAE